VLSTIEHWHPSGTVLTFGTQKWRALFSNQKREPEARFWLKVSADREGRDLHLWHPTVGHKRHNGGSYHKTILNGKENISKPACALRAIAFATH